MPGGRKGDVAGSVDVKGLIRDRPWLLPSNRKLRHLQGVSIRNLELLTSPNRSRGKTIDDESLPNALKTPAKALAQREKTKLEHSRSSGDLKANAAAHSDAISGKGKEKEVVIESPPTGRLRRRKTLNWTNTSPTQRQERLETATREKLADSWFSLHVEGVQEPIYVSEVIGEAMNPSFRFFDLNCYPAFVTRLDECTVRYWVKAPGANEYSLFIELRLSFRSLQYIGKSIESFHHPLPHNAILFHLADGIYTSLTDLPFDQTLPVIAPKLKQLQNSEPTSSFDALMRLSNLDDCIQDALVTREKLTSQINNLLKDQEASRDAIQIASQAEESLAITNRYLSACGRQVQVARKRRDDLQAGLAARRQAMQTGAEAEQESRQQLKAAKQDLSSPHQSRQSTKLGLAGQIRRIGEDLSSIYPIDPLTTGSLAFTIRSLHLPKAGAPPPEKDNTTTAAALGHTAHLTHLLSLYLSVALPYPITPHSSTSTIYDPISTTMPSEPARTFPLYQKGAVAYRFEYGVFLLNADIELLMSRQGARMVDLRHTLANLKYILTVITEGKGDVPGRKRGQIKGLNGSLRGAVV